MGVIKSFKLRPNNKEVCQQGDVNQVTKLCLVSQFKSSGEGEMHHHKY